MNTISDHYGPRCESCRQPMQRDQDRVHVFRFGEAVWMHLECMLRLLGKIQAETVTRVVH